MSLSVTETATIILTKEDIETAFVAYANSQNIVLPPNFTVNILLDTAGFAAASDDATAMSLVYIPVS